MANLKLRLTLIALGLVLIALALGATGPYLAQIAYDQFQPMHQAIAAFVFVGLCGVLYYGMLERALNPVIKLTDHFRRIRLGDLDPRLPIEGPKEMQEMAQAFNDTMEDLEVQIRDITEEKHGAERGRRFLVEQLEACEKFKALIDAAPVGAVLADENLTILYQNASSESGFAQLSSFLSWNSDVVIGRPLSMLFPDEAAALTVLSDPDRLPHEEFVAIGPYQLRYLAWPVYSSDDEYIGPMLLWEVEEASKDASKPAPMVEEFELVVENPEDKTDSSKVGLITPEDIEIFQEKMSEQPEIESSVDKIFGGKLKRGLALVPNWINQRIFVLGQRV